MSTSGARANPPSSYDDLVDTPILAAIATSGDPADLDPAIIEADVTTSQVIYL